MRIFGMFSKKEKDKQEKEPLVEKKYDHTEVIKNLQNSGFVPYDDNQSEKTTNKGKKP